MIRANKHEFYGEQKWDNEIKVHCV